MIKRILLTIATLLFLPGYLMMSFQAGLQQTASIQLGDNPEQTAQLWWIMTHQGLIVFVIVGLVVLALWAAPLRRYFNSKEWRI